MGNFKGGFTNLGAGEIELCEKNYAFCWQSFNDYDENLAKELDDIIFGPAKLSGKALTRFLFSFMGYGTTFEGD